MNAKNKAHVTVIGAGFTGLTVAYELAKKGISVTVLEAESTVGGLAASFDVGGNKLDRFYHHWFTNDIEVINIINELGLNHCVEINPTNTSVYYANKFFKLSTPWDLIKFTPLNFLDRIRLGVLTLRARRIKNWKKLESKTARDWLKKLGGENVYRVIWEPLLRGKFGSYADDISAVWFWNKLKLRGGSRGKSGEERLVYFKGGFAALAEALACKIQNFGGRVEVNSNVVSVEKNNNYWVTSTLNEIFVSNHIVITTALPLVADMIRSWAPKDYIKSLERINYIGNICLVLELDRSLSSSYWLNVNDPNFPFVGLIEHTNFERPETYGGRHIVYLSKYLPYTHAIYSMESDEFLEYAFPYLKRMFPSFEKSWIKAYHLWKARWSQPVVEKFYGKLIPAEVSPFSGFYICSMAQIYPEDRGTNYAIKSGKDLAKKLLADFLE